MDPGAVRLLLVEDCNDDAELLALELVAVGFEFEMQRVQDMAHLREALGSFRPHVVISDGRLPGFSGLEALHLVRELMPSTPFLFLSGDDDEHVIAESLGRGAAGYLSKQDLSQLPAAIARILGPLSTG